MSITTLSAVAFLAAIPLVWCIRCMVFWMSSCLEQAERLPRPGMDEGSKWMPLPAARTASSGDRRMSAASLAWDAMVFLCLATLLVCCVIAWGATVQAVTAMILVFMLVALARIDIQTRLLPNALTKTGLVLGLIINVWSVWIPFGAAAIGALAGYWLMWLFFQLYLLVTKAGQRYWRMDYRFGEKRATAALGVYPTITLAEARAKRLEIKKQIAEGINPAAKRKIDKITGPLANVNSFKAVAE